MKHCLCETQLNELHGNVILPTNTKRNESSSFFSTYCVVIKLLDINRNINSTYLTETHNLYILYTLEMNRNGPNTKYYILDKAQGKTMQ